MLQPLRQGRYLQAGHPRPTTLRLEIKRGFRSLRHARSRLTVLAGAGKGLNDACRMIGTVSKQIDVRPMPREVFLYVLVNSHDVINPVQTFRDSRLVRHYCNGKAARSNLAIASAAPSMNSQHGQSSLHVHGQR